MPRMDVKKVKHQKYSLSLSSLSSESVLRFRLEYLCFLLFLTRSHLLLALSYCLSPYKKKKKQKYISDKAHKPICPTKCIDQSPVLLISPLGLVNLFPRKVCGSVHRSEKLTACSRIKLSPIDMVNYPSQSLVTSQVQVLRLLNLMVRCFTLNATSKETGLKHLNEKSCPNIDRNDRLKPPKIPIT